MPKNKPQYRVGVRPLAIFGTIALFIFAVAIVYPDIRALFPEVERSATTTTDSFTRLNNNIGGTTTESKKSISDAAQATSSRTITVVAENLSVPWDIAFLPDGTQLVTQRPGTLVRFTGDNTTEIDVPNVSAVGEGGLLGLELDPSFQQNGQIYLYTTTAQSEGLLNRVVRFRFNIEENTLTDRKVLIDEIPGAAYHDGGRIRFGPDGNLYITTGDAGSGDLAQSTSTLAGKILRINPDGSIPESNPFDSPVFTYGHRNPQGLAWDDAGRLWSTEHGRSGVKSGFDEVNLIEVGNNYGWPVIQGPETKEGMTAPKVQSGPETTWAPASAAYHEESIYFGGLRGSALYEAVLEDRKVIEVKKHLFNRFGRIRTVKKGPYGYLYITTSNTDGRGDPNKNDDKVIRINPRILDDDSSI